MGIKQANKVRFLLQSHLTIQATSLISYFDIPISRSLQVVEPFLWLMHAEPRMKRVFHLSHNLILSACLSYRDYGSCSSLLQRIYSTLSSSFRTSSYLDFFPCDSRSDLAHPTSDVLNRRYASRSNPLFPTTCEPATECSRMATCALPDLFPQYRPSYVSNCRLSAAILRPNELKESEKKWIYELVDSNMGHLSVLLTYPKNDESVILIDWSSI